MNSPCTAHLGMDTPCINSSHVEIKRTVGVEGTGIQSIACHSDRLCEDLLGLLGIPRGLPLFHGRP